MDMDTGEKKSKIFGLFSKIQPARREASSTNDVPGHDDHCASEVWSLKSGTDIDDLRRRAGSGIKRLVASTCPKTTLAELFWRENPFVGTQDVQVCDFVESRMRHLDWKCGENCEHPSPVGISTLDEVLAEAATPTDPTTAEGEVEMAMAAAN